MVPLLSDPWSLLLLYVKATQDKDLEHIEYPKIASVINTSTEEEANEPIIVVPPRKIASPGNPHCSIVSPVVIFLICQYTGEKREFVRHT
jgi:hypothetical protein